MRAIKRIVKVILYLIGVLSFLIVIIFSLLAYRGKQILDAAGAFNEIEQHRKSERNIVGDLGGLKVCIPRHMAEFVEYNGDPGFGEKRKVKSERTFDSKIRSFAMTVQLPSMRPKEKRDGRVPSLDPYDPWLSIGVTSGEHYPALGTLAPEGRLKGRLTKDDIKLYQYSKMSGYHYGLEVYKPVGIHPTTGISADEDDWQKDVYAERNQDGSVGAYIDCSRRGIRFCTMTFVLEPEAKVDLNVRFRIGQLKNWQEIKDKSKRLLLGFNENCISPSDLIEF